jgi:hypothetical protein
VLELPSDRYFCELTLADMDNDGRLDVISGADGPAGGRLYFSGDTPVHRASQSVKLTAGQPSATADFGITSQSDADAVPDNIESGVPNRSGSGTGDGNGDNIPDSQQVNVASLPSGVGSYATLVSPSGTRLVSVSTAGPGGGPGYIGPPYEYVFPAGFFGFAVEGVAAGGTVDVEIIFHTQFRADTYFKVDPYHSNQTDAIWLRFDHAVNSQGEGGATFFDDDQNGLVDRVILRLVDGGPGDNDVTADGRIVDPGGPALRVALPRVESVRINDGSPQRSKVNSLTVTFDRQVIVTAGAFELRRVGASQPVHLNVLVSEIGGKTIARLTFPGHHVGGSSLADGTYQLRIRANKVHTNTGRLLDGNGDGLEGGDRVDAFFRHFGDTDGDGDVDGLDRKVFNRAYRKRSGQPGYLWYLDANGNGRIAGEDLVAFLLASTRRK